LRDAALAEAAGEIDNDFGDNPACRFFGRRLGERLRSFVKNPYRSRRRRQRFSASSRPSAAAR
jgi:vacuolar-type H+-ATPase catalytic subunit A/Vma1